MGPWARMIAVLAVFWLLTRWLGFGGLGLALDLRMGALWAAILLATFLLWRDGRPLLVRFGLARKEAPLAILEQRLARGEITLRAYRALRREFLSPAGINAPNKNTEPQRILRGDPPVRTGGPRGPRGS